MAGTAWTLPLYELALMTAEYGRRRGLDLAIEVITSESAPLGVFGAEARAAVRRRLTTPACASAAPPSRPSTRTAGCGWSWKARSMWISWSRSRICEARGCAGLPHESGGFVPVDGYGRVPGVDRVWAVGDMTTRPLKQGGLAAQQADVAAADIASQIAGGDVEVHPYEPKLQGMLLTGADPLYLAAAIPIAGPQQKVVGAHLGPYLEALDGPVAPVRPS